MSWILLGFYPDSCVFGKVRDNMFLKHWFSQPDHRTWQLCVPWARRNVIPTSQPSLVQSNITNLQLPWAVGFLFFNFQHRQSNDGHTYVDNFFARWWLLPSEFRCVEFYVKIYTFPLTCTHIININKNLGFEILKTVTMNSNILLGHDAL